MGKGSRFLTAEREWHGKVGSHLVDGTGRDGTGVHDFLAGRDHGTGREQVGNSVGNIVGKSVGNVVGLWPRDAVRNGWEHDRERRLETTVEKRKFYRVLFVNCYHLCSLYAHVLLS